MNSSGQLMVKYVTISLSFLCRGHFNIQKFSLSCGTYNSCTKCDLFKNRYQELSGRRYQIDKWVRYVLRRNVQELQLEQIIVSNPTLVSAVSQVKVLRLKELTFQRGETGELLFSCLYMETLILEECDYSDLTSLTIDAPQLKYLIIENTTDNNKKCVIKICAPNLISIKSKGCLYQDYCLDKFPVLDNAYIDFYGIAPDAKTIWKKEALCFNKFLIGVVSAKSLTIAVEGFQCFSDTSGMLDWIPVSCQNLKYLKLKYWSSEASIRSISTLLESFPHLETLIVEVDQTWEWDDPDIELGNWGTQLSLCCKFLHLKSVEIHNLEGCQNELKLLEFLVRNASVLETITIRATITSANKEEELIEFSEKLQLLPKASSVKILLILKYNS